MTAIFLIELAGAAHAAADVDGERLDAVDRFADITGMQAASQEDRHRTLLNDTAAEPPIVSPAGAPQLLDRQSRIPGVQQQGVDLLRGLQGLVRTGCGEVVTNANLTARRPCHTITLMEASPEKAKGKAVKTMKKVLLIISSLAFVTLVPLLVRSCLLYEGDWVACRITTSAGEIQIRVYPKHAPLTAANFLRYVETGLYNGSSFFRVVTPDNQPNDKVRIEVIQGGDVAEEKCFPPIAHETTKTTGLHHEDSTVSMARAEPGTATSSFFICINNQPELDFGGRRNPDGQGFAAFGRVVKGMEVVRRIQCMAAEGQILKKPVVIISLIRMLKPSELPGNTGTRPWRGSGIGVIGEAIRAGFKRMTPAYYLALFLVVALAGWLGWHSFLRGRWARGEATEWQGSSWSSSWETAPWLRALGLVVLLTFFALFAIMLVGI